MCWARTGKPALILRLHVLRSNPFTTEPCSFRLRTRWRPSISSSTQVLSIPVDRGPILTTSLLSSSLSPSSALARVSLHCFPNCHDDTYVLFNRSIFAISRFRIEPASHPVHSPRKLRIACADWLSPTYRPTAFLSSKMKSAPRKKTHRSFILSSVILLLFGHVCLDPW
jgi:hypothetical protein